MKILHIIASCASGGAEIFVRDLSREMAARGHEVGIAYISDAASLGRSGEFEADYKRDLTDAGVRCVEIGHSCRRRLWRGGARLKELTDSMRPDIIHSHLYYGLLFQLFSGSGVPIVYTHHNFRMGKGKYLYPLFNRIVSRYIGISQACADALRASGAKNIETIYNAIPAERIVARNASTEPKGRFTMLTVGRLERQKNQALLLRAIERLLMSRPELRPRISLRIAGEGPLQADLQRQIVRTGLDGNVALLGVRKDIPQLLAGADLFVLSSDYEGLPIALLEAMMAGLPVVVTDVGGCREVVEQCGAGLIVPARDQAALTKAMEKLIDDPDLRRETGARACAGAGQFSIAEACSKHLALYQDVAGNGAGKA